MAEQYWICQNCNAQNRTGPTTCVVCGTPSETARKLATALEKAEADRVAEQKRKQEEAINKAALEAARKKETESRRTRYMEPRPYEVPSYITAAPAKPISKPAVPADPGRPVKPDVSAVSKPPAKTTVLPASEKKKEPSRRSNRFGFWYGFMVLAFLAWLVFFTYEILELRDHGFSSKLQLHSELEVVPIAAIVERIFSAFTHAFSMDWAIPYLQNFWESLWRDTASGKIIESPYAVSMIFTAWWIIRICARRARCNRRGYGTVIPLMIEAIVVNYLLSQLYLIGEAVNGNVQYSLIGPEKTGIWLLSVFVTAALTGCVILLTIFIGWFRRSRGVLGREITALLLFTLLQVVVIYGLH